MCVYEPRSSEGMELTLLCRASGTVLIMLRHRRAWVRQGVKGVHRGTLADKKASM